MKTNNLSVAAHLIAIACAAPIAAFVIVYLVYAMALIIPAMCVIGCAAIALKSLHKRYALYRFKRFAKGL